MLPALGKRILANKEHEGRVRLGPLRGLTISARDNTRLSYWSGTYERHVVRAMTRLIRPGMIAYDIGAHIGYMSLVQSKLVGRDGNVVAFEPDPGNFTMLESNIRVNRITNTQCLSLAVSYRAGAVDFATFDYSFVSHIAGDHEPADARIISAPTISLDDFVYGSSNEAPDFMKIDTEGAEDSVFLGAIRLITAKRPIIIAEVRKRHFPEISALMRSAHYTHEPLRGGISNWEEAGIADIVFLP